MRRYLATSQRFQFAARAGLELLAVHGSLRMKYGVGQLNSFSRPRDVLSDKFTVVWTRTSRRSPPLYAMTFGFFVRRARVSLDPPKGQTGPLYPQLHPLVFKIQNFVTFPHADVSAKRNRPPRKGDPKRTGSPSRGADFYFLRLLQSDLCASCFESCLCLLCCLLVCLLKKGCWSCIDEILSFLETKC